MDVERLGQQRQIAIAGDAVETGLDAQSRHSDPAQRLLARGEARDAADGGTELRIGGLDRVGGAQSPAQLCREAELLDGERLLQALAQAGGGTWVVDFELLGERL